MTVQPLFRPYKYKLPRRPRIDTPGYSHHAEDEGLTGYVNGLEASDLEERFARALRTYNLDFQFQFEVETAHTLPHQEKQVDFLVEAGQPSPWEVDGNFTHKTADQREYDRERDAQIDKALAPQGYARVQRVTEEHLGTQEFANAFVGAWIA